MNNTTINLSSVDTSYTVHLDETVLYDHTRLQISLNNVTEAILPLYVNIDWGDGVSELFDNNIYVTDRESLNILKYSPVLSKIYDHEYLPSNNSLYKSLSAQVLVSYTNGDYGWFVIPVKIRTYDFFESIYDLELVNVDMIPTYPIETRYQFLEDKNKYLVQLHDG